jgi:hypothetical protein
MRPIGRSVIFMLVVQTIQTKSSLTFSARTEMHMLRNGDSLCLLHTPDWVYRSLMILTPSLPTGPTLPNHQFPDFAFTFISLAYLS